MTRIYVFQCNNESGDRWVEGCFTRELTEEEQHGYFAAHYEYAIMDDCDPDDPEDANGVRYLYWDMVELEVEDPPAPLPRDKWSRSI